MWLASIIACAQPDRRLLFWFSAFLYQIIYRVPLCWLSENVHLISRPHCLACMCLICLVCVSWREHLSRANTQTRFCETRAGTLFQEHVLSVHYQVSKYKQSGLRERYIHEGKTLANQSIVNDRLAAREKFYRAAVWRVPKNWSQPTHPRVRDAGYNNRYCCVCACSSHSIGYGLSVRCVTHKSASVMRLKCVLSLARFVLPLLIMLPIHFVSCPLFFACMCKHWRIQTNIWPHTKLLWLTLRLLFV